MAQELNWQERPATGRRSAFEVRMDILKVASEGCAKPTHIMYRSNTSWIVLQKNLEALTSSGFIRESGVGSKSEYAITESGLAVLRDYANLVTRTTTEPLETPQ
jgi:predicted transcriptional regulator